MIIKRIKYSIVLLAVFFSFFNLAYAGDIVINEFVSHPNSGEREWVELRNTTESPINLNGWKLTELSSPNTNPTEKNLILLSGTINDILIFDVGATKLNDGGDSIGLYSGENEIDRVTYGTDGTVKNYSINLSAPDIGKSGALISSNWVTNQEPTKNSSNSITNSSSDDSSASNTEEDTDTISTATNESKVYKITTKIISPKIVTAGVTFSIDHSTTGLKKEKIILGKFVWNFGDGMKKEGDTSPPFPYIYQYPGDYVLTLAYFDSSFDTVPDTTDRIVIKVIPAGIVISSVGTSIDPFIEIENNSNYEMSLREWIIKGNMHSFVIPEGMVVLPNKKLKLSPKITGFDFNDLNSISIIDQTGQIFATYPNKTIPTIKYSTSKNTNKTVFENMVKSDIVENNQIENVENNSEVINLNDLGASASLPDGLNKLNKGFYSWLGLVGIIVIGGASVLLLRRKDEIPDYIEKEISAEDMKIIE